MNKKSIGIASIIAGVVLPMTIGAATTWSGSRYVLQREETHIGNAYVVSERIVTAGTVKGDLVSIGGKQSHSGRTEGDVLFAGGEVSIDGVVTGDVRGAGGEVSLYGSVGGDVALVGGTLYIASGSRIAGDVITAGGDMTIAGAVAGRVRVSGGDVSIEGPVSGSVEVEGGRLFIGEKAVIAGDVSFRGPRPPFIDPGATIQGKTNFIRDDFGSGRFGHAVRGLGAAAIVVLLLMSLVTALALFGFFKQATVGLAHAAMSEFWPHAARGLGASILIAICSVLLIATVIGLPIGVVGVLVLFGLCIVGNALAGILFGVWAKKYILRQHDAAITVATVVWGTLALRILAVVPVIGALLNALFLFVALGVLAAAGYRRFWLQR